MLFKLIAFEISLRPGSLKDHETRLREWWVVLVTNDSSKLRLQSLRGRTSLADSIRNTSRKVIGFRPTCCLCIDTHCIFSTTGTGKTSSFVVPRHEGFDLGLKTRGGLELTLCIVGLEDGAIIYLDSDETGREVSVGSKPFLRAPSLMGEDSFNQEHVRNSIANCLVDQVSEALQTFNRPLLGRRLGLCALDGLEGGFGKGDRAVAICLKVDTNIKTQGGMVKVLYSGVGADRWELQHLLDIIRAGTVRIRSLDHTNLEILRNPSVSSQVANEGSRQRGNAITIEESKTVALVHEVIDKTISIAVQGCTTVEGGSLRRWRGPLLCLDKIGTTLDYR